MAQRSEEYDSVDHVAGGGSRGTLVLSQHTLTRSTILTTKEVDLGKVLPVQGSQYVTKDGVKRARPTTTSSARHVHPAHNNRRFLEMQVDFIEMVLAPFFKPLDTVHLVYPKARRGAQSKSQSGGQYGEI